MFGLFFEGIRSKDGELGKGMVGVGFFVLCLKVVVVFCVVIGLYKCFVRLKVVYGLLI